MEFLHWLHWLDNFEPLIVTLGLLFTAYSIRKDEKARQVSNMLVIQDQHDSIWSRIYENPELSRVLKPDIDFRNHPVTVQERIFVKSLFLHLDVARRARREGMYIELAGLKEDIRSFMSLPIPKAVWEAMKPFQDADFIRFVKEAISGK